MGRLYRCLISSLMMLDQTSKDRIKFWVDVVEEKDATEQEFDKKKFFLKWLKS